MDQTGSSSQRRVDALRREREQLRELEVAPVVLEVNRRQLVRELQNFNRELVARHLNERNPCRPS